MIYSLFLITVVALILSIKFQVNPPLGSGGEVKNVYLFIYFFFLKIAAVLDFGLEHFSRFYYFLLNFLSIRFSVQEKFKIDFQDGGLWQPSWISDRNNCR